MQEKYGIPFLRVSYFGIEDMAKSLYDVADLFDDAAIRRRAEELVGGEVAAIMPELRRYCAGAGREAGRPSTPAGPSRRSRWSARCGPWA